MHCNIVDSVIHIWNAAWETPKVISPQLGKLGGKTKANWLFDEVIDMHTLMLGKAHNYDVGLKSRNAELLHLPTKTDIPCTGRVLIFQALRGDAPAKPLTK